MQEMLEIGRPSLGPPRSPPSILTDSNRRASLRNALPARNLDSARASSPTNRLSRKRAASLQLETSNRPRFDDLTLDSAGTSVPPTADLTREQVCLCQPDPKIPRPRNGM
jgi:HMG box factor